MREPSIEKLLNAMADMIEPPPKPTPTAKIRLIRNFPDSGKRCVLCGSSMQLKWMFFDGKKCIQPECENYFEKTTEAKV